MSRFFARLWVLTLVAILVAGYCTVSAAADAADSALEFPENWIGGGPYSVDSLRGKGVVLYFFEELCPRCKGEWPRILQTAKEYQDQPVVFIAVNSGTPKTALEGYAQSVKLNWPLVVDSDRSFEKACHISGISLQNIMQMAYITPAGELKHGRWDDLEGTIKSALEGAKWNVDPAGIPTELRPAWRHVEMSRYSKAAPLLNKAVNSDQAPIKAAAQKLSDGVNARITSDLKAASDQAASSKWAAYKRYGAIAQQYNGFPAAGEASKVRRELGKDPQVKTELAALKILDKNKQGVLSPNVAARKKAIGAIKKMIEDQPDTEAAKVAKPLVDGR